MLRFIIVSMSLLIMCSCSIKESSQKDTRKIDIISSWFQDKELQDQNEISSWWIERLKTTQSFWDPILTATFVKNIWWYPIYGEDYSYGKTPPPYDIFEFEWLWLRLETDMIRHRDSSLPFLSGWNIIFTKNGSGFYTLSGRDSSEWFIIFDKPEEQTIEVALKNIIKKEWKNSDDCKISKNENSGSIVLSITPKIEYIPSKIEVLNDLQKSLYKWISHEEIENRIKDTPEYGFAEAWLQWENSIKLCGIFSQKFVYKAGGVFIYNPEATKEHFIYFNNGNGGGSRGSLDGNLYFFTK